MRFNQNNPHFHNFTIEEYLALEQASERRWEYWDGEIVCVNGIKIEHAIISSNVMAAFSLQVERPTHQVFGGLMPIKTLTLLPYRYPDLSVTGNDRQFERSNDRDILLNPMLVAEIIEPETEAADRNEKRCAYQAIPSLLEYLLSSCRLPHVTRYSRQDDGWQREDYGHLKAVIELPLFSCQLALADIYEGVIFA